MFILAALLFFVTARPQVTVIDTAHTRLSRIIESSITDELRSRSITVGDDGDYVAEIADVSDASGRGRASQIATDFTNVVQVTEVLGGAAADVRLYDRSHTLIATYKLSGSGSSSASVGVRRGDVITAFIVAPFFRRSRSSEGARAIGHDVAVSISSAIGAPAGNALRP